MKTSATPPAASETSDADLVRALQAGDVTSLGDLFRRHHRKVFRLGARLTGSEDAAHDVVQETFLRVLRHRDGFRSDARFTTWLYRIARNVALDTIRARERKQAALADLGRERATSEPGPSADRTARVGLLTEGLRRLSRPRREILILARFHGLKYREIAEILGSSEVAVRVRAHRAMVELKEIVRRLEQGAADDEV